MIWRNLFNFVFNIAYLLIGLLPSASPEHTTMINNIVSAFNNVHEIITNANFWFPMDTLVFCIQSIMGILFVLGIWKGARWIMSILSLGVIK